MMELVVIHPPCMIILRSFHLHLKQNFKILAVSHVRFRDSFDFVAGLVLKRTVWLCSGQEIILIAWQVYIQQQKLGEKFLYIFTLYIFSF